MSGSVHRALGASGLAPGEKLVLVAIASHADEELPWPSLEELAEYLDHDQAFLGRAVCALDRHGLIVRQGDGTYALAEGG